MIERLSRAEGQEFLSLSSGSSRWKNSSLKSSKMDCFRLYGLLKVFDLFLDRLLASSAAMSNLGSRLTPVSACLLSAVPKYPDAGRSGLFSSLSMSKSNEVSLVSMRQMPVWSSPQISASLNLL